MQLCRIGLVLFFALQGIAPAQTQLIDFENFAGPAVFSQVQPPLTVAGATFSGGQILRNTTFVPVDQSTIYGTAYPYCSGCLSTLTITFSQLVSNFSVFVINGNTVTVTYTIVDDSGDLTTITTVANLNSGAGTVSLPSTRIHTVAISAGAANGGCCAWDFFIDNVRFTPSAPVLLDPAATPSLLSGAAVTTNTDLLATEGSLVQGVAADGIAQVVVRIPAGQVGEPLLLTILNDQSLLSSSTQADGALLPIGAIPQGGQSSFTTSAVATLNGSFGFAVYRAPTDFIRSDTDSSASQRSVTIHIQFLDPGGTSFNIPVKIVRPPVVLIHGLWDDTSAWNSFAPLLSDTRFFVRRASYSAVVNGITASSPGYDNSFYDTSTVPYTLKNVRQNAMGFAYNAPGVLAQIRSFITEYKNSANVAVVQADIVAHSMGGDITRSLRAVSTFSASETYGMGNVHKLITIGTPHLGTPLAGQILSSGNSCTRNFLASNGNISLAQVLLSNAIVSGAVGDLQGDGNGGALSGALTAFDAVSFVHTIPTALLAGIMSSTNLNGLNSSNAAFVLRNIYRCSDTLATDLTASGWQSIVGQQSDSIVPLKSETAGNLTATQYSGVVHSGGMERLGFTGPNELTDSRFPQAVITLLNTNVLDSSFHPL